MLTWPAKDPDEVLDYDFDWATYRLAQGETINTSTWTVVEGDVVINSSTNVAGVTTVWLSGGTVNTKCVLTNHIVTSQGRTYERSATLRIRSK
jgi:hypothetical protein